MTKRKGAGGAVLLLPVLLLLIAVILILTRGARRERMQEAASAAAGVDYIRAMELMDPGEVESQIKAIRAQELAAMRQQRLDDAKRPCGIHAERRLQNRAEHCGRDRSFHRDAGYERFLL